MAECEHNYIFQNTNKKHSITGYEHYTAVFERIDRYYCSKCLEIKEIVKKEAVSLPFGGIRNVTKFSPVWYR